MATLRETTLEFLSICDGAHQMCKGFHWQADKHSLHILMDDVDKAVLEYQDKIAEAVMGMIDDKFKVGELKALVSDATTPKEMLVELGKDIIEYKKKIGENEVAFAALHNILDDFLTDINTWKYLETLA